MKKLILILLLLPVIGFSQDLKMTPEGYSPIVILMPGKTAHQLYERAKNWANSYFESPNEAIKVDVPGKTLRVSCYSPSFANAGKKIIYDAYYNIRLDFKDGKYRITFIPGDIYNPVVGRVAFVPSMYYSAGQVKNKKWAEFLKSYDTSANAMVKRVEAAMKINNDNW